MFDQIHKSRKINILLVIIADILLTTFIVFVIFTNTWLDPIEIFTRGLINVTLIVNLGLITVGYLIIIWKNDINGKDLGIIKSKVILGIIITAVFWGVLQILNLVVMLIQVQAVDLDPTWEIYGFLPYFGDFIAQIFGNAFYEEMIFRGFLIPQFYFLFKKEEKSSRKTLIQALFASQVLFALKHVPIRLLSGSGIFIIFSIILLLGIGFIFALIYLRTDNLFIAIGLHSIFNVSLSIFNVNNTINIFILIFILLIFWPKIENRIHFKKKDKQEDEKSNSF